VLSRMKAGSGRMKPGSGVKRRAAAGIHFALIPFGDKGLVGATVLMISNAVMAGLVWLGGVTEFHILELRAQKMTLRAPICNSRANPRAAGITERIVSSSTPDY
jgi:hypothetical protein